MKRLLARVVRMSPAMVVAMLALFVALTGTAVATSSALITGNQIKNSSITGLDVKNKSLTPRDFRGSVRGPRGLRGLTGATGAAGAAGAAGAKGEKGDKGDKGDIGPSESFFNNRTAGLTIPEPGGGLGTPITTLTVPGPGSYLLHLTGTVTRNGLANGDSAGHQIQLRRGAVLPGTLLKAMTVTPVKGTSAAATATYAMTVLVNVTGASEVFQLTGFCELGSCPNGTSSTANHAGMTATRVGTATGAL